jgi:transposase
MSKIRFIGLDVHAGTIAIAVAEPSGEVRSYGVIPNRLESIRKTVAKLGPAKQLKPAMRRVRPGTFCIGN